MTLQRRTKKLRRVPLFFCFLVLIRTYKLTPEFYLSNETGIADDARQESLSFDLDDKGVFLFVSAE
jgi:hypothetical protein